MAEAGAGPSVKILNGHIQLFESLVLGTVASVPFLTP